MGSDVRGGSGASQGLMGGADVEGHPLEREEVGHGAALVEAGVEAVAPHRRRPLVRVPRDQHVQRLPLCKMLSRSQAFFSSFSQDEATIFFYTTNACMHALPARLDELEYRRRRKRTPTYRVVVVDVGATHKIWLQTARAKVPYFRVLMDHYFWVQFRLCTNRDAGER